MVQKIVPMVQKIVLPFRYARARLKAAQAQFTIIHAVPYTALTAVKFPNFCGMIGAPLRLKRPGCNSTKTDDGQCDAELLRSSDSRVWNDL